MTARDKLATFDITGIPTLDVAVLAALELWVDETLPILSCERKKRLVMGSVNALEVAKIIYASEGALVADENTYLKVLNDHSDIEEVVVVSASGSKHAVTMVAAALARDIDTYLITNTNGSPAGEMLPPENIVLFPKNREPYTYNTSTYIGPILAKTGESASEIMEYLLERVSPKLLRNFGDYRAFTFILPDEFSPICAMVKTKFDELFGPMLVGRAFTESEIKHAKTVVVSGEELFISLGVANEHYGLRKNRLQLEIPKEADFASFMAATYFIVGKIQAAHPPYFQNNIEQYCILASQIFGHGIAPIVE